MSIKIDWMKIDMDKIMRDLKIDYGKQMKEARLALGLKPEQVAVEIGVSPTTIYNNEAGKSCTPGLRDFYKTKLESMNC